MNDSKSSPAAGWEPRIIGFLCNWCAYSGGDGAGRAQGAIPPQVKIVRVMCSGRVDVQHILEAFEHGADGVLVLGCHPGDCHYKEGNYKTLRRMALLKKFLSQMGLEDERLRLDWVSASEGEKFAEVTARMVEDIRRVGPRSQPFPAEERPLRLVETAPRPDESAERIAEAA
jgi:F420-non-reducing hydrogenase iron-sulfur subunit